MHDASQIGHVNRHKIITFRDIEFFITSFIILLYINLSISVSSIACDNGVGEFYILFPLVAFHSSMKLKKTSQ